MPKTASLKPVQYNGKWVVNVPASQSETGRVHRKTFKTKREAQEFSQNIRAKFKEFGEQALTLSPHDSTDAAAALQILRPLETTLLTAARFYQKHHDARAKAPTIRAAISAGIERRGNNSAVYLSNLKHFERRVPDSFKDLNMADVEANMIEDMLNKIMEGNRSRDDGRRHLSLFFEDQIRAGNLTKNPCKTFSYPQSRNLKETSIYTVGQLQALFDACKLFPDGKDRDCRACAIVFAFLAFAGIRPAEIERMSWDDVVLANDNIRLLKRVTKTAQTRNIPITPTLRAWIESVNPADREGKIIPSRWRIKAGRVKKHAKLDGNQLQDALRHSYGSYWLAMNPENIGALNMAMGHQHVTTYFNYYHKALTKKEAAPYWQIFPSCCHLL